MEMLMAQSLSMDYLKAAMRKTVQNSVSACHLVEARLMDAMMVQNLAKKKAYLNWSVGVMVLRKRKVQLFRKMMVDYFAKEMKLLHLLGWM